MKKAMVLVSLLVLSFTLSGCGSNPDSLMKDQISAMNDLADAYEKNEPKSKIEKLKKRMDENSKKMEELNLSVDEKKQLVEKHKDELAKATARLVQAAVSSSMNDMNNAMKGQPVPGFPAMP
jgi:peptidoglycan hydrolase CwlO-like protein